MSYEKFVRDVLVYTLIIQINHSFNMHILTEFVHIHEKENYLWILYSFDDNLFAKMKRCM